jgi:hypothetical protein
MKFRLIVFIVYIAVTKIYSLEVSIIDVIQKDDTVQIDIEIFSENVILLPENLLTQRVTTGRNVFNGNDYQIFYACLIKSALRGNRFILAVSNENLGPVRYSGTIGGIWLTGGLDYVPFSGVKIMSIIIDKINIPYYHGQDKFTRIEQDNYIIDEISLSICYSNDNRLNKEGEDLSALFFENFMKISSVAYRLTEPFIFDHQYLLTPF